MRERMAGEFYGLRGRLLALEKAYNHGREGRLTVTGDTIQSFPQLQHTTHREFSTRMDARDLEPILDKVRPFVMPPVSIQALVDLANVVLMVLACDIPGDFVECGVWRGGTGWLMAEILRQAGARDRKVWLFDSFEGMPPGQEIDGPRAMADAIDPANPVHIGNSRGSLEDVQTTARELGLAGYSEFVKGWFEQTLPVSRKRIPSVAILHLDCDWHASVRCCLDNLYDQVVERGFVILDDYYGYDGCAIAVHEFLAERRLAHRIESVVGNWGGCDQNVAARFRKGKTNWQWEYRLHLAEEDIATVIPPGQAFILVDDGVLGHDIGVGRRAIPFLERDGRYWGRPSDGDAAIREFERSRGSGQVSFMVFTWPAFWWLDYYPELHRHLASAFRCVLRNDRVLAFDLGR